MCNVTNADEWQDHKQSQAHKHHDPRTSFMRSETYCNHSYVPHPCQGAWLFSIVQLLSSLIWPREFLFPSFLRNLIILILQIEEAGNLDELSRNFVVVIVPFKNV